MTRLETLLGMAEATPLKAKTQGVVRDLGEDWYESLQSEVQHIKSTKVDRNTLDKDVETALSAMPIGKMPDNVMKCLTEVVSIQAELREVLALKPMRREMDDIMARMTAAEKAIKELETVKQLKKEVEDLTARVKKLEGEIKGARWNRDEEADDGSGRLRVVRKTTIGSLKYDALEGDVYMPEIMSKISRATDTAVEWGALKAQWKAMGEDTIKIMTSAMAAELFIWVMETLPADKMRKVEPAYEKQDGMKALAIIADEVRALQRGEV